MQPVDATSNTYSVTGMRVTLTVNQKPCNNLVIERIPVIEPVPHYPLSATVSEMMAHINELIKEQQIASQKALHEKNVENARDEMARLFEAVNGNVKEKGNSCGITLGKINNEKITQAVEFEHKAVKTATEIAK